MSTNLATITGSLWPRASYPSWLVAGAPQKAAQAYGTDPGGRILDVGALRDAPAGVEVLTPNGWTRYDEREHQFIANVYNRVGPGWSFGSNSIHNSARGWFETVHGRRPDPLENIDIQFNRALFESLREKALGPETGGQTPGIGGQTPGIGGQTPGTGGQTPGTGGQTPGTGGQTPGTGGQTPGTGGQTPGTSTGTQSLHALSPADQRAEELRIWLSGGHSLLPGGPKVEQAVSGLLGDAAWKSFTKLPAVELIRVWRLLRKTLGDTREIPKEDR